MKAQSDLIGDYERTAEMTAPRFCGVTKWMNSIDKMGKSLLNIHSATSILDSISGPAATIAAIEPPAFDSTFNTEVNHRPAAQ